MGMGIQQYAMIKRVETAADMLRFSDESILAVSNYLCFSSQSHFGKIFKDQMGVTPQKYRDKYKLIDLRS
jgi:transcriptional regulator GlxA family with amidase domain